MAEPPSRRRSSSRSRQDAARRYCTHDLPLPNNCMVPGNTPKPAGGRHGEQREPDPEGDPIRPALPLGDRSSPGRPAEPPPGIARATCRCLATAWCRGTRRSRRGRARGGGSGLAAVAPGQADPGPIADAGPVVTTPPQG